jgi:flagellin
MEQAMERLSSGKRINSAMDDAAGLTIAHSLDGKIAGLNQAVRNANDGVALVNLSEGALEEVSSMLVRMKELATQSLNSTYSNNDRSNLDKEYQALVDEIDHIAKNTKFNGSAVLYPTDGNTAASLSFQVGDGSSDSISLALADMDKTTLGLYVDTTPADSSNDKGISTTTLATAALTDIDAAISSVDGYRATLGATANRLDHAATNLMSRVEHHSAALSRIEDADYAVESANLAKAQVLQQAGTAMLAQANASTSNVVSLLR